MARPQLSDHMQGFRFHAKIEDGSPNTTGLAYTEADHLEGGEAGFQSITIPELSLDPVEYREGTYTYTRKYPGVPTVSDVSFMRGVLVGDTSFFDWVLAAAENREYRANIQIWHYHRNEPVVTGGGVQPASIRYLKLWNAFPTRVKPMGDLDASSGDVSIMEMDCAVEQFTIESDV